ADGSQQAMRATVGPAGLLPEARDVVRVHRADRDPRLGLTVRVVEVLAREVAFGGAAAARSEWSGDADVYGCRHRQRAGIAGSGDHPQCKDRHSEHQQKSAHIRSFPRRVLPAAAACSGRTEPQTLLSTARRASIQSGACRFTRAMRQFAAPSAALLLTSACKT